MICRATPSQTIGPFFHRALLHEGWNDLAARGASGERVAIEGRVLDGDGAPVSDAMIEVWQANAAGRYDHPEDLQETKPLDPNFTVSAVSPPAPTDASACARLSRVRCRAAMARRRRHTSACPFSREGF